MAIFTRIKNLIKHRLPIYRSYRKAISALGIWRQGLYPPGHFYSPVISPAIIPDSISIDYNIPIPGINLNDEAQFELLKKLQGYYDKEAFPVRKTDGYRYYFDNEYFSYSDGMFLMMMIRHFKPSKIIEIGSGFSSALMLDTNTKFLNNSCQFNFIEPYPEERLNNLIVDLDGDILIRDFVQNVKSDFFKQLKSGDVLFIDSSHISKFRSDLNYLLFEILPLLDSGVIVHFHDILFPFEYPQEWLKQGRSWNEAYMIRAFLQHNSQYDILLFTSYLEGKHREWFEQYMSLCLKKHELIDLEGKKYLMDMTGQSLYLIKK